MPSINEIIELLKNIANLISALTNLVKLAYGFWRWLKTMLRKSK
jgi:hypothetical protein